MSRITKLKRLSAVFLILVFMFSIASCAGSDSESKTKSDNKSSASKTTDESETQKNTEAEKTETDDKNVMVVYFSATGTTKGVAEKIAEAANGDIYEIVPAQPYTSDDLNWNDSNSRTTLEQDDPSVRPGIGSEDVSLDGYSTVFIGFPIWWGEEPRIMDTFVEKYDFDGKTVIPFCTSGGSGIGSSGDNLKSNAGSGNWLEGERLSDSSDIEGWVKGFDLP